MSGIIRRMSGTRVRGLRRVRIRGVLLPDLVLGTVVAAGSAAELVVVGTGPGERAVDAVAVLLTTVVGLSLSGRRRWPVRSFAVGMAAALVQTGAGYPGSSAFGCLVVGLYSVGAYGQRRSTAVTTALVGATAYTVVAVAGGDVAARLGRDPGEVAVVLLALLGPALVGDLVRVRREYQAELVHRATRSERLRRLEAEYALAEERSRIARELHDVIAHHVSGIVLQAGAAERQAREGPPPVREGLRRIRDSGTAALMAMREVVTVLRADEQDDIARRRPQPALHDLGELLDGVRTSGHPVEMTVTGEPPPALPAQLELCAYRIVQEALTNCVRHAPGSTVSVGLSYGRGQMDLRIVDQGTRLGMRTRPMTDGGGHGLVGMRERVAALNGRMLAGPIAGGWLVHAVLPIEGAAR